MNDMISRKAAIEALGKEGLITAMVIIDRMPSAQPFARGINVLSNDLISRQEAIDALEEYADRLQMVNWKENPGVPYKAYALNWCINTIRDLPSAQPDGIPLEWINKHLEWLDNCDNDFAQLAKVSIRAMVECYGRKTGFNKQTGGD